jgi:hypothetical protein
MYLEEANFKTLRQDNYILENDVCDDILTRNGEEVISRLQCVGILNAPQTGEDHFGDCRLYLTKSKIHHNNEDQTSSLATYRSFIFLYCW